jgi:hypothetical protein
MNDWVDLSALWRIVVIGLLAGAGLPALFAVGVRTLATGAGAGTPNQGKLVANTSPAAIAIAGICFAAVLAGIGWGIYFIVAGS